MNTASCEACWQIFSPFNREAKEHVAVSNVYRSRRGSAPGIDCRLWIVNAGIQYEAD